VFDLFATPSSVARPERAELAAMARKLADACRRLDPLLDPANDFARVSLPIRLFHGRGDRLIPFTEGMRLQARLSAAACQSLTVTGLFGHSAGQAPASALARAREGARFFASIRGLLNTV
jgi:fermentation-respiration switch protein FrsA (DUF1100 family)